MKSRALVILLLAIFATPICTQSNAAAAAEAPPTPAMPAHWTVTSDINFASDDIRSVGANLGARLSALRNTTYNVGGRTVKLNTIVAATAGDADSVMRALGKAKPSEWFLRRGLVIYEFVGPNDAIPEMRKARDLLPTR